MHHKTGLMWMRCALGQTWNGSTCTGSATTHTWQQALQQAANATFAGYGDWRLPSIKELSSLAERRCYSPAINATVFPNTRSSWFWSSSVYAGNPYIAWNLDFSYGYDNSGDEDGAEYARLVRGGQSFNYFTLTVTKAGNGAGTVTSSPAGIDCGADCEEAYDPGAVVTLTATPVSSTFAGWSGDPDCADGQVTLDTDKTCTATFTLLPPAKATLIAPKGTVKDNTPTYQWNAVPGAAQYRLKVQDSTGTLVIGQWYTAAQAGCSAGTGTCAVTPDTVLAEGAGKWWIRTRNAAGYGPWSKVMKFKVVTIPPLAATLIAPTGAITDNTPTYQWNAVANAAKYYLKVKDGSGTVKIGKWYTAAQAGCAGGTGICAVTPDTALADGAGQWWIRTGNAAGNGPWSAPLAFTLSSPE